MVDGTGMHGAGRVTLVGDTVLKRIVGLFFKQLILKKAGAIDEEPHDVDRGLYMAKKSERNRIRTL